jgi:DNA helicase-2/ATP-dependent DNA helicase PcrA
VIELINKIRQATDKQVQIPRSSAEVGHVRMFVLPSEGGDKATMEQVICAHMAKLTDDPDWENGDEVKVLILEHRMAALRMGFDDLLAALYPVTQFRTALLDGSFPPVNFFSNLILPLWDNKNDRFATTRIIRAASPLISAGALKAVPDQFAQLNRAQAAVDSLIGLLDGNPTATFEQVLRNIAKSGLFSIPDALKVALVGAGTDVADVEDDQERTDRDKAITAFLAAPFAQVRTYTKYVSGKARFDTHQGVKGLEFPRVMVVMDDHEARGFLFKYEKLFSGGAEDGQTTSTRRLFYVTCSRAERSLALVAYAKEPERIRAHLLENGWFAPEEISIGLP